ncbi:MAG TPA: response regulator [Ktedonobacterales bacterium]
MKTILVADDDPAIAEVLRQSLESEGYETYKVTESLRFFDAVMQYQPDIILLDLMMPYLDGEDELRLLQMTPSARNIPVIVITAKHEAKLDEARYRPLGVVEILTKPFDLDKLVSLIRSTVEVH